YQASAGHEQSEYLWESLASASASFGKTTRRLHVHDSRSQIDFRDHTHHRTEHPVWRIFPADVAYGPQLRLHRQCAAAEFLSRRTRTCRRHRNSVAYLPVAG